MEMKKMTAEQIEQKKQLLAVKMKEMKAIFDELVEAGAVELSEEELDEAAGGVTNGLWEQLLEPYILQKPKEHPWPECPY